MAAGAKGFGITLDASTAAALLSGGLFLSLLAPRGPGRGATTLLLWAIVLLPQALAAAAAGLLARTRGGVALNALAFFLPQAGALVLGFLLFAHPGGAAGWATLAGTGLFWVELGLLYLAALALVGLSSALAAALLRR